MNHSHQLWVEPIGDLIIVRVRGVPSEALLRECHERLIQLVKDTGQNKILYDVLELEVPPIEVPLSQWKLDSQLGSIRLKRAILVPNTKLAYLSRLAFGEDDLRVFYNDMPAAVKWLTESRDTVSFL